MMPTYSIAKIAAEAVARADPEAVRRLIGLGCEPSRYSRLLELDWDRPMLELLLAVGSCLRRERQLLLLECRLHVLQLGLELRDLVLIRLHLRIEGLLLAVVTLVFAVSADRFFYRRPFLSGGDPQASSVFLERETIGPFDLSSQRTYYYLALIGLALTMAFVAHLRRTGIGRFSGRGVHLRGFLCRG